MSRKSLFGACPDGKEHLGCTRALQLHGLRFRTPGHSYREHQAWSVDRFWPGNPREVQTLAFSSWWRVMLVARRYTRRSSHPLLDITYLSLGIMQYSNHGTAGLLKMGRHMVSSACSKCLLVK
jgi:hypothetical protein